MPSFTATHTVHIYVGFVLALRTELLQADKIWYLFCSALANYFFLCRLKIVEHKQYIVTSGQII
jgi:hypothetical protein